MTWSWSSWSLKVGLVGTLAIAGMIVVCFEECALAQITPDKTLRAESSVVTPLDPDLPVDAIDGGAQRGANLFHSFQEFNVSEGRGVYFFSTKAEIQNILTRVTGGNPSKILGTLGTYGESNPNLFLMNPNGIIFGPNASLDMGNKGLEVGGSGGSFVATTANAILLANAGRFSASEPGTTNLLSVNPSALFFNAVAAQGIEYQSTATSSVLGFSTKGLQVPNGRSLLLVGGNVSLNGARLAAAGGRIELGGVAGSGTVGLSVDGNTLRLGLPINVEPADILLTNQAFIGGSGAADGDVRVQGRRVILNRGSQIGSQVVPDTSGRPEPGGNIVINASESVELIGTSADNVLASGLFTNTQGVEDAGNLVIKTKRLVVRDGAQVSASTFGKGGAGALRIRASEVDLSGESTDNIPSGLFAQVYPEAVGKGGNLTVETGRLLVRDGAQVSASTFGKGDAGIVSILGAEAISFDGVGSSGLPSGLLTSVEDGALGSAGDITVESRGTISLTNGAQLRTATRGGGDAGNVTIRGAEAISLAGVGSGLFSSVFPGGVGNGGNVDIQTRSFFITNGAQVSAAVEGGIDTLPAGVGDGGNIRVQAGDINIVGVGSNGYSSGLFTNTGRGASGSAGDILVRTSGTFRLADGALISAQTSNSSDGGRVAILAETFEASDGGQVLTISRDRGAAGDINLKVADSITLAGSDPGFTERFDKFGEDVVTNEGPASGLFASTTPDSTGDGGNIFIDPIQLSITDGAVVSVSGLGTGDAGSIEAKANSILLDNQGQLIAETSAGEGGNIILEAQENLLMRRNSLISAEARGTGESGNIDINTEFLITFPSENSDIIASAKRGGNINITAEGIFGSQFQENLTLDSDITATGTVTLNTPDIEFQSSLTQLSANFTSPEQVVSGSCLARRNVEQGSFVVTGTGGLPRSPYEAISGRYNVTGVQPIQGGDSVSQSAEVVKNTAWKKGDPVQEAQGMVVTDDGRTIVGTTPQLVALAKAQKLICHSD